MVLVGKARRSVVGVLGEARADQPTLGHRGEAGQAGAGQKIVDQGRDEDGLAGPRQAGDAQPKGGGNGSGCRIGEIAQGDAQFVGDGGGQAGQEHELRLRPIKVGGERQNAREVLDR